MSRLSQWFQSLRRPTGTVKKNAAKAKPLGFRPRIELLEDRLTPSTLTVTSNADSGAGSLRNTIATANSGDTIIFASSIHSITLTSGELEIGKNLNIQGPGANNLTISGNNASRVFHIDSGETVTLANMTVAHGYASGELGLDYGFGYGGGGGILNEAGATLTLSHDTIHNNQALGAVGFTVVGGGLLNLGNASVVQCSFSNNQASGGGNGADSIGGAGGGAIDNFGGPSGGANIAVANSTFSNNGASAAGGGFYFGVGGAIDNNAGLAGFEPFFSNPEPSTASVTNCTFVNNQATGGSNATGQGGALDNTGAGATTALNSCTLSGNSAVGGGGGDGVTTGDSEATGGCIENSGGAILNVQNSTIANNQAIGGSNTVLSTNDPVAGGAFGGAIENAWYSVLNISGSVLSGNLAQGGTTASGPGADAFGGGIGNTINSALTMTSCTVTNNSAKGGRGARESIANSAACRAASLSRGALTLHAPRPRQSAAP